MSLSLPAKSEAGVALQAVLLSLARQAWHDVERVGDRPEERIHSLRTGMKKYRSLLRLAGGGIKKWQKSALCERIGRLKDGLAVSRDDVVIVKTVREVLGVKGIQKLGLKPPKVEARFSVPEAMVQAAIELVSLTEVIDFGGLEAEDFQKRFRSSLRKDRAARATAEGSGEAQDFHVWRKRVKDIWYQAGALRDFGKKIAAYRKPAEALSDVLGREHDLTIVLDSIKEWPPADREIFEAARQRLRTEALAMDGKL